MRLFVAADLPAEARRAYGAWRDEVAGPGLRPVGDDALHVTLSFLGERGGQEVDGLVAALFSCAGSVSSVRTAAPRWLPARRPRVLVVTLDDPEGGLGALRTRVSRAVGDDDRRPFLPHVTVGRVRGRVHRALPPGPSPVAFDIPSFALYRSHLGTGPARYECLWRQDVGS